MLTTIGIILRKVPGNFHRIFNPINLTNISERKEVDKSAEFQVIRIGFLGDSTRPVKVILANQDTALQRLRNRFKLRIF